MLGLVPTLCLCAFTTAVVFSVSEAVPVVLEKAQNSGLRISINAGSDAAHSTIKVTGSLLHIVTDTEAKTFGVSEYQLRQAVGKYFGRVPEDAWLHSPTPWGDLFKLYSWEEAKTVLIPTRSEILGVTTESLALKDQVFVNNSTLSANYNVAITDSVQNSVTNSWSTGGALSFEQKFTYDVGFLGTGAGGETSFSYSQSWGVGGINRKDVTMGSSSGVMVMLKPGQSVRAALMASRGVMKARVYYKAYLTGTAAINYDKGYKGHHYWNFPITRLMSSANIPNSVESTEDIEVGYFSNGRIVLHDATTSEILAVYNL